MAPDPRPVVARHLDALGRYPDPAEATAALAAAMGVAGERLLLTNGGAEAIALVAADTGPGWADACDFSLYRRHLPGLDPAGPRWRSDPHNPLGTLADPEVRADVWDEAFYPLATGRWTAGRPGFALGSLTKLLACPGLRAGYVVCPDRPSRDRLAARQPRWAVNGLACAALPELLGTVDLPAWAAAIGALRSDLVGVLVAHGLQVRAGAAANWVLVEGAPELRGRLAPHAVVVRDCTSFGLPGVHRIAVPSAADLPRLATALEAAAACASVVAAGGSDGSAAAGSGAVRPDGPLASRGDPDAHFAGSEPVVASAGGPGSGPPPPGPARADPVGLPVGLTRGGRPAGAGIAAPLGSGGGRCHPPGSQQSVEQGSAFGGGTGEER